MPLIATTPDAICDRDAISFVMLDGESFVRVDVPRRVLDRLTSMRSREAQLAFFNERRPAIERIASEKYDAGEFCGFANSRVVPIMPADLLRLAAEGHA
jgi:hypothetical protein